MSEFTEYYNYLKENPNNISYWLIDMAVGHCSAYWDSKK